MTTPKLMRVVFVMGANGVGKSTYIADRLASEARDVFDMYQYQEDSSYPSGMDGRLKVALSYPIIEHDVRNAIQRTLFMEAGMRDFLLSNDKDISDREPELIVVEGTYLRRARRASIVQTISDLLQDRDKFSFECICIDNDRGFGGRELLELPTVEEGFHTVTLIEDFETDTPLDKLEERVAAQKKRDRIREHGYFPEQVEARAAAIASALEGVLLEKPKTAKSEPAEND